MGRREVHTGFWWRTIRERDHLKETGADGSIILRWIFRMWEGWYELDSFASG